MFCAAYLWRFRWWFVIGGFSTLWFQSPTNHDSQTFPSHHDADATGHQLSGRTIPTSSRVLFPFFCGWTHNPRANQTWQREMPGSSRFKHDLPIEIFMCRGFSSSMFHCQRALFFPAHICQRPSASWRCRSKTNTKLLPASPQRIFAKQHFSYGKHVGTWVFSILSWDW